MDKKQEIVSSLWVEQYRPKYLNDMVLPSRLEKMMKGFIDKNECSNLLLCSTTAGTGKTSLAKVIANELKAHTLYLNVSENRGIDTLRDTVRGYASGKNYGDRRRVIILDEMEKMAPLAQAAFRGMLEELSMNASFIMTCNNVNEVIKPLREGRTFEIDMDYHSKEDIAELKPKIAKRLIKILKEKNIEYEVDAIKGLVNNNFPSIRKMISLMHSYFLQFDKIDSGIISNSNIDAQLIDLVLEKNFSGCRQFVKDHALDFNHVYKYLFDNLPSKVDKSKRANVILAIAEGDYRNSKTSNSEIQWASCLLNIFQILSE